MPSPRQFGEVPTLYSTQMSSVFSGGLVYEYSQEPNNYGLVEVSNDGNTVTKRSDFDSLKKQYSAAKNPTGDGGARTGLKVSKCPAFKKGLWEASDDLPSVPSGAETYFVSIPLNIAVKHADTKTEERRRSAHRRSEPEHWQAQSFHDQQLGSHVCH